MPTSEPDCPFCEIVQRDDSDVREVYRDDVVVVFAPTEPATLGHLLVIPKVHTQDIWSVDEDVARALASTTVRMSHAIRAAVEPDGLNVIQSNGEAATQTVMHLHVHLVPRWHKDPIGRIWPPETAYSEGAKDSVYAAIRAAANGTA